MTSLKRVVSLRHSALITAVLVCTVLGSVRTSAAQGAGETRGFVTINGGYQLTSTGFSDNVVFTLNVEEGDFDAGYRVDTGAVFDVSGGVRVSQNLAIGVGVSRFSRVDDASVTARIPHPFFFDQHRPISGSAVGLQRQEIAVHAQALWIVPVNNRFDLALFGGPTFVTVTQDLLTKVRFTESYPFDTATFTGVATRKQSASGVGFNVGVDVAFYFSQHVGVGWLARFSRATIDLALDSTVEVNAGGLHTGGGLRLRF